MVAVITGYSMDGTSLAVKTDNPYLGVQIDNKMSWSPYVNIIVDRLLVA